MTDTPPFLDTDEATDEVDEPTTDEGEVDAEPAATHTDLDKGWYYERNVKMCRLPAPDIEPAFRLRQTEPDADPELTAWVQGNLNRAGGEALAVDGKYNYSTACGVRRFQVFHGLTRDALVGPQVVAALANA